MTPRKRPRPKPKAPNYVPNYVALASKNLEETKEFYSKLFGWKFRIPKSNLATFMTTKKGVGGVIRLTKKIDPGTTVFYVSVKDISKIQHDAVKLGAKVVQRTSSASNGLGYSAKIRDPQGNIIGLFSRK